MGATYGTVSIKEPTREALADWLRSKSIDAFVMAEQNGWTTFSDRETNQPDPRWIEPLLPENSVGLGHRYILKDKIDLSRAGSDQDG